MAQTAVDIVVKVAGDQKLKQLDASLRGTAANSVQASAGLDKSAKSAQNLGNKAKTAKSGVDKLTGAIKGLLAATALINTAKFVIVKTSELETQTRSLQVLTGELETAKRIIGDLQQFAAVTPFRSAELIETAKRLKAFGVDTEKLVDTTKRLADVSGATGAALDGVATAYGQIQAKGRLQGEELLQLQERGIGLQGELQKMYGLSGEEFSKALQKGQFSAKAVEVAIKRLTDAGGKYADGAIAQSDTLAGRFSTLQDGIENLARTIGNVLSPAIKFVVNQAIEAINYINTLLNQANKISGYGIDDATRDKLFRQAGDEAAQIARLRGTDSLGNPDSGVFNKLRNERFSDLLDQYGIDNGKFKVEIEPVVNDNKIPDLLKQNTKTKTGGSSGRSGAGRESKVPQLERELELARQLEPLYKRIAEAEFLGDKETVIRLQGQQELLKLKKEEADIVASNSSPAEKLLEIEKIGFEVRKQVLDTTYELKELEKQRKEALEGVISPIEEEIELLQARLNGNEKEIEQLQEIERLAKSIAQARGASVASPEDTSAASALVQQRDELKEQVAAVEKLESQFESLASGIAGEMTSAFRSIIDGTKSVEEAFADMLKGIADKFLDMAMKILTDALTQQLMGLFSNLLGGLGGGVGVSGVQPQGGGFGGSALTAGV